MFQTITFKGFRAQVTARVSSGGLIYLEMAGAEAEVKAIWARLVSAKTKKSGHAEGVEIEGSTVSMEQHVKYITLKTVLPNGQHAVGLLAPQATIIEREESSFVLIVPSDLEGHPPAFFPRLAATLAVPIKKEWAPWLWEKGQETGEYEYQKLIFKLPSSGHAVGYGVRTHDAARWLMLIQAGIGFKVCDYCCKPVRELVKHIEDRGYGLERRDVTKMICQECEKGKV